MGRASCCSGEGIKRGSWTAEEDHKLKAYIESHGEGGWRSLPAKAGLERCGKSCRLRWSNYLKPGIKRGSFTPQEDQTIIKLHAHLGNRWAAIARQLQMRTDNEIKNYWNAHLKKRVAAEEQGGDGVEPAPPAKKPAVSSSAQILNRLATRVASVDAVKTCLAVTHQWVPADNNKSSSSISSATREEEEEEEERYSRFVTYNEESGNDDDDDDEGQCSKNDKEEGAELKNESSSRFRLGNCNCVAAASAGAGAGDDDDSSNKAADKWGVVLDGEQVAGFPELGDIDSTTSMLLFGMEMEVMGSPFLDSRILLEDEEDLSTPPPTLATFSTFSL